MSPRYGFNDYGGFPEYVPVGVRRARAKLAAEELRQTMDDVQPIVINGRKLARNWWGQAWNTNLERYSDFSNRLPRGRSYVRHGSVLHLDIQPGCISSLVQGSRGAPYQVTIQIAPLDSSSWQGIVDACSGKLDSARELLQGKFPEDLMARFTEQGSGLFPAPDEIELDCSCPDWASMCKHVAATLYGVGARLDDKPALFFVLRQVDPDELLSKAVQNATQNLTERAQAASDRVLQDADLEDVFGIDLDGVNFESTDDGPEYEDGEFVGDQLPLPGATRQAPAAAEPAPKPDLPKRKTKRGAKKKKKTRKRTKRQASQPDAPRQGSLLDQVLAALAPYPDGASVQQLIADTKLKESQIRNAIARARQQGRVCSPDRGLYQRTD